MTDDLDGSDATQTIRFSYQGSSYEIDLNDKNAAKLDKSLQPFIEAGRREKPSARHAVMSRGDGRRDVDPAAVRAWAQSHGYEVSSRGRVRREVIEAFQAAGN